jgi:cytochrome c-type biogenesis protein CcmH
MTRRLGPIVLAALVVFALVVGSRTDGPASDGERVERLTEQLRCPVCDGLAVADSPSSTARAIASDVRSRVAAGETDAEVRRVYVAQYGEWILLDPPAGGFGAVAWLLPLVLLVVAVAAAAYAIQRRAARRGDPPTAAARRLVAESLSEAQG